MKRKAILQEIQAWNIFWIPEINKEKSQKHRSIHPGRSPKVSSGISACFFVFFFECWGCYWVFCSGQFRETQIDMVYLGWAFCVFLCSILAVTKSIWYVFVLYSLLRVFVWGSKHCKLRRICLRHGLKVILAPPWVSAKKQRNTGNIKSLHVRSLQTKHTPKQNRSHEWNSIDFGQRSAPLVRCIWSQPWFINLPFMIRGHRKDEWFELETSPFWGWCTEDYLQILYSWADLTPPSPHARWQTWFLHSHFHF